MLEKTPALDGARSIHAATPPSTLFLVLDNVRDGDSAAQRLVYQKYSARLLRLAATRIAVRFQSKLDPEDIVQSVFRSFFVRYENGRLQFETWNELWGFLARVTIRKCNRAVKRLSAEKRDMSREVSLPPHDGQRLLELVARDPKPEEIAIFDDILDSLLHGLTKTQQEIVFLKLQDHSNVEISQKLNRSERTIYRLLNELRQRMESIEASA